ncbi:hypothetical protein B0H21DRAFT_684708 [Amylocystis lapponica]|nr:hypothetical protein B0H21DRAFT_684708 [Amylocystis lapponica]
MSHLLSNSVHRPYLFDLPRPAQPITPPETDNEFVGSTPTAVPPRGPLDSETHASYPSYASLAPAEPFDPLHRKVPSISYVNSSLRESRERVVQRSYKWLVVVIPPPSFSREHGHLGHTLSSGPPDRLSQGLLMPLYPTMNSQLTAIAREFNLPSITGLCVYLRTNQNGLALNPRISDESWSLLWSHLFDARSPTIPLMQMPISGQIEFDIDIAKARWYDVWLGIARRDAVDVPRSVAPSRISHGRGGDSRTSFLDDHGEDQLDNISLFQQTRTPFIAPRLVPKKLSLLDRLDSASARSAPRAVPRQLSPNSPNEDVQMSRMLSPIVQEEEPKTARRDIDKMVNSWRASASISRSPLAATGQTSLDPANLPNTLNDLPIPSPVDDVFEMNLDDYTWSISSAGPPDYDPADDEFISWVYSPSVHLDRRLQGSVLLTPSSHTSFGPPDDDYDYLSVSYSSRLPSPDIAMRLLEDAPPTPSTATSWGAPSYYPPSPSFGRAPSVDIALRHMHSRPVTPATATSWGAPSSYPPSPVSNEFAYRVPSPDIALRGMSSVPHSPLPMIWRKRASTSSQPWNHVWPYNAERDVSDPSHFGFPYYEPSHDTTTKVGQEPVVSREVVASPSTLVFPYYSPTRSASLVHQQVGQEQAVSQEIVASPSTLVFPYYSASRSAAVAHQQSSGSLDTTRSARPALGVASASYPHFNLYPAVYPFFDLYPATVRLAGSDMGQVSTHLDGAYPVFSICESLYPDCQKDCIYANSFPDPAAYPHLEIYPGHVTRFVASADRAVPGIPITLRPAYPTFRLYPAVYPDSLQEIYPPIATSDVAGSTVVDAPVYPHNLYGIYPPSSGSSSRWSSSSQISMDIRKDTLASKGTSISVGLSTSYPTFNLYPKVYPYSLEDIYPSFSTRGAEAAVVSIQLSITYPNFDLSPQVYPYSLYNIYPEQQSSSLGKSRVVVPSGLRVKLEKYYPTLEICEIFPSGFLPDSHCLSDVSPSDANVYPYNVDDIYPAFTRRDLSTAGIIVKLPTEYPGIMLYPPVYPFFALYPEAVHNSTAKSAESDVGKGQRVPYPAFMIYPSVYPYIVIYPAIWRASEVVEQSRPPAVQAKTVTIQPPVFKARRRPTFSHADLHKQVYPSRRRPKYSHSDLRNQVFAEQSGLLDLMFGLPATSSSATSSPATSSPVTSSPTASLPINPPASTPPRARARSSTVSRPMSVQRPIQTEVKTSPTDSPVRRPFSVMGSPATQSSSNPPSRTPSLRAVGLPSNPAVTRRMSTASVSRPTSSAFAPMPTVEEPDDGLSGGKPLSNSTAPTDYMRDRTSRVPRSLDATRNLSRAGSNSATLPQRASMLGARPELSRSLTMPSSNRGNRLSMVRERAMAYDQSSSKFRADSIIEGSSVQATETLEPFPGPPRIPLPPLPKAKAVSKLDRSKYPFA